MNSKNKINNAISFLMSYGPYDGAHHKTWVIDQTLRILAGDRYEEIVEDYKLGEDGPDTYEWDVGTPP